MDLAGYITTIKQLWIAIPLFEKKPNDGQLQKKNQSGLQTMGASTHTLVV
jgi:hypothetical protein